VVAVFEETSDVLADGFVAGGAELLDVARFDPVGAD